MSEHLVQFYETNTLLADATAHFLNAGLAAGETALVIATPPHHEDLRSRIDRDAVSTGRYVALDAADVLSQLLVDGVPDRHRFRDVVGAIVRRASRGDSVRVRAFGEMVALLAVDGAWDAALRLEAFWNALIRERPLTLLCAYPSLLFEHEGFHGPFGAVCAQHTGSLPSDGVLPLPPSGPRPVRQIPFAQLVERALDAVRPLTDERQHEVTVTSRDGGVSVAGDRVRLEHVFVSLLANAARFTPAHGRIDVSTAREGRHAVLRVRDSGAGIVPGVLGPESDIAGIRPIVEVYGGLVEVHSGGVGAGVEFVIRLPIASA